VCSSDLCLRFFNRESLLSKDARVRLLSDSFESLTARHKRCMGLITMDEAFLFPVDSGHYVAIPDPKSGYAGPGSIS
jgi:hypothetical protein